MTAASLRFINIYIQTTLKMVNGLDFDDNPPDIAAIRQNTYRLKNAINQYPGDAPHDLLRQLLGSFGEDSHILPHFLCEFGKTIHIGDHTFINMGVTMLNNAEIHIGSNVLIGPNAQFYTPTHPLDYQSRRHWETFCKPIVVEDDVWVGGHTVICQGVPIGARSVVTANSTVTRDAPPDTLAAGSPARIIRSLATE
ncbi:sugar O-acetyltransferase [Photobacterium nomapromontoriensis]|uniref:sugar O-acetyltransferase n=1 Tax=Photobacterium nomapromontoriensis TaxID=2910237 RepID=UPI003D0B058F